VQQNRDPLESRDQLNGVRRRLIEVVPYDPRWPSEFARFREALLDALRSTEVSVEHVGSTAVPGLIAKPILDVDIVIRGGTAFAEVRSKLEDVGYVHRGDQGIPGREAFRQREDEGPRGLGGGRWPKHHLYACYEDSTELERHVAFRDALRSDPYLADRYADLKRNLVRIVGDDRERYSEGKSEFVRSVLSGSTL
jgi:GrpB-like predicted nucleotidyltransferase (UPF0157 family)